MKRAPPDAIRGISLPNKRLTISELVHHKCARAINTRLPDATGSTSLHDRNLPQQQHEVPLHLRNSARRPRWPRFRQGTWVNKSMRKGNQFATNIG